MSEDNKKRVKKKKGSKFKKVFLSLIILGLIATIAVATYVFITISDAPKINPSEINSLLNQTSQIVDQNGEFIEKIQTLEYRTVVDLEKMPKHLQDAFTSIEDERFYSHFGVDIRGILGSIVDNIKAGSAVRGASTITQQLSRNLYLTNEKKLDRKVKEAYIAIQLERALTKDQIMEAYLNRIYLGQGAYGVQEASKTYFGKDVENLTIAEAATLAGIVKSPTKYSIYKTVKIEDFKPEEQIEVGRVDILGDKYVAIYNQDAVDRQKIVLSKMLELGKISQSEYDEALQENIQEKIKPERKTSIDITSYFNDLIKSDVVNSLIEEKGMSKEDAEDKLYNGGLTIYSTMNIPMQKKLEDIYSNFTQVLLGGSGSSSNPAFISWKLNQYGNVVDGNNNIIFFKKGNMMDGNNNLVLSNGTFTIDDNGLTIQNQLVQMYQSNITIKDYYTIDDNKNLVTHQVGNLNLADEDYFIKDNNVITIKKSFLDKNPDFYKINENNGLALSKDYFYQDTNGVVQPQSSSVLIDHSTGHIKALVGGRDVKGAKILNRALVPRQPGSSIKPLAAYLPALDNGFTAASGLDDTPMMLDGKAWPKNWYSGYRGLMGLRESVEQSVNTTSVKAVDSVGIPTSMEYLTKMGIINKKDSRLDSFVTKSENQSHNDENLSALGLGGMSKGTTPLQMAGAFASVANDGKYLKPISFTKVIDSDGKVLIDNTPKSNTVVSPQVAFITKDILRTTVSEGIAKRAQIPNMTTAGKTGTTQEQADAWFVGFTPYYTMSTWIGNDIPQLKLNKGSSLASQLWKVIMSQLHEDLENKPFKQPEGIKKVSVCTLSGKLPTDLCSSDPRGSKVRSEFFVAGTEPKDYCDVHQSVQVDTSTNMLANEYCPSGVIGSRVFIKRTPPYRADEHGGIYPGDYQYNIPNGYCTVHSKGTISTIIDSIFGEDEDEEDSETPENEQNEGDSNQTDNDNANDSSEENNQDRE